jgi:hypothetical protein
MSTYNNNTYYQEQQDKYEASEIKNTCIECGIDMGYMNPRQYCGKTYCMYSDINNDDNNDNNDNNDNK